LETNRQNVDEIKGATCEAIEKVQKNDDFCKKLDPPRGVVSSMQCAVSVVLRQMLRVGGAVAEAFSIDQ